MEIFISNGAVEATITTKPEKISLDNAELYKLIQADKELLRLIKIRLDKKPEQLKPITRNWEE